MAAEDQIAVERPMLDFGAGLRHVKGAIMREQILRL